ncbi:beta-ketoacyl-ACP synthase III, partial [Paraburkholderia sp. BR14261]
DPQSIDLIIVATSTPDFVFPSTACLLQNKLGIRNHGAAFDVQAVCSGFAYAVSVADSLIRSGQHRTALVVGAETFSRILDFNDRTTCVLFGDGAGAIILQASSEPGVLSSALHADGSYAHILCTPGNVHGGVIAGNAFLHMDGQAVFKLAVNVLEKVAIEALDKAQLSADQVDWLIPHQANIRIMQGTCRKLGLPAERMVVTVGDPGNTSAASSPLAVDVAVRDGRIKRGHNVLIEGVGGGVDGVARGAGGGVGSVCRRVVGGRGRRCERARVACLRLRRAERGGRGLERVGRSGGGSRRRGGWRCRWC